MQFSGETNNLDLFSECRDWCGIPVADTTTLPIAEFTRSANFGLDRIITLILKADGKWQFDDANNTGELLDVTTDLVAGTQKYAILVTWLRIKKVRIKDQEGSFVTLKPIDRRQLSDAQLRSDAGDPKWYDKLGNFLYLHPKPSYASSGGLEVQYQRGAHYFVVGDTTAIPGFDVQFHRLVALYGALDYCEKNDLVKRAATIRAKIGFPPDLKQGKAGAGMEGELVDFYSDKDKDQKLGLRVRKEDYGQFADDIGNNSRTNQDGFNI